MNWLWVALGGSIGSVLRYAASRLWIFEAKGFPWATCGVNLLGSLAIGLFWGLLSGKNEEAYRLFLITGVLGGFTTYSGFAMETLQLFTSSPVMAVLYVLVTLLGGLGLAGLGYFLTAG